MTWGIEVKGDKLEFFRCYKELKELVGILRLRGGRTLFGRLRYELFGRLQLRFSRAFVNKLVEIFICGIWLATNDLKKNCKIYFKSLLFISPESDTEVDWSMLKFTGIMFYSWWMVSVMWY